MGDMERGADGRRVEGQVPNKLGNSDSDFLATWTALGALMAALLRRARTGQGQWIDLAMYQTGVTVTGTGVLDFAFNGRRTPRIGHRHPAWSPPGVYPCHRHDPSLALPVRVPRDWPAPCRGLGTPGRAAARPAGGGPPPLR